MPTISIDASLPAVDGLERARVRRVSMQEHLNEPFSLVVSLTIPAREMMPNELSFGRKDLINQLISISVLDGTGNPLRQFSGIINGYSYQGCDVQGTHIELSAVPKLWFMGLNRDCSVNQNKSAADLLKAVASRNRYSVSVTGGQQPIEYAIQYRESDLEFFNRICVQEGLSYHFEDSEDGGLLSAWAEVGQCQPISPAVLKFLADKSAAPWTDSYLVQEWTEHQNAIIAQHSVFDYRDDDSYDYNKLNVTIPSSIGGLYSTVQRSDFPGGHARWTGASGTDYANLLSQQTQSNATLYHGTTTAPMVQAGKTFTLTDHPYDDFNDEYLITGTEHTIEDTSDASGHGGFNYACQLWAVKKSVPYKPGPLATPPPRIHGIHTAVVMGPPNDTSKEIHTDDRARILVRFMWDQNQHNASEASSCWIRVAQQWAGNQWGAQFIPRVGTEVLVSFIEGDPDRPIITGQVYNSRNQPIFSASESYKSGWRSRSTLQGGVANFSEFSFYDQKGSEVIYLHAEKDHREEVENDHNSDIGHDESTHIHHDRTETVDNNETVQIGVNRSVMIGGNKIETIGQNKAETIGIGKALTIGAAYQTSVGAAMNTTVGAAQFEQVGLDKTVMVGKKFAIVAGDELSITVGSSTLVMTSDGNVTINGTQFSFEASGPVQISGKNVKLN